jgi:hypothetical protein
MPTKRAFAKKTATRKGKISTAKRRVPSCEDICIANYRAALRRGVKPRDCRGELIQCLNDCAQT